MLTNRPAELPASEPELRRALLLLLAGPAAAQPTTDTTEATRLLLTLLARPAGQQLVPAAVLRLLGSCWRRRRLAAGRLSCRSRRFTTW